jgi:phospholipid-transporting ATPase
MNKNLKHQSYTPNSGQFSGPPPERKLTIGDNPTLLYGNNKITTSKYSPLTFFPHNLFFQITKTANIYFILITILQTIKPISLSGGIPTMLVTLVFVIVTSMIKDFIESYKLWKRDSLENNTHVGEMISDEFTNVPKSSLRVGSIVKVT